MLRGAHTSRRGACYVVLAVFAMCLWIDPRSTFLSPSSGTSQGEGAGRRGSGSRQPSSTALLQQPAAAMWREMLVASSATRALAVPGFVVGAGLGPYSGAVEDAPGAGTLPEWPDMLWLPSAAEAATATGFVAGAGLGPYAGAVEDAPGDVATWA